MYLIGLRARVCGRKFQPGGHCKSKNSSATCHLPVTFRETGVVGYRSVDDWHGRKHGVVSCRSCRGAFICKSNQVGDNGPPDAVPRLARLTTMAASVNPRLLPAPTRLSSQPLRCLATILRMAQNRGRTSFSFSPGSRQYCFSGSLPTIATTRAQNANCAESLAGRHARPSKRVSLVDNLRTMPSPSLQGHQLADGTSV